MGAQLILGRLRLAYPRPDTIARESKIGIFLLMSVLAGALVQEARRRMAELQEARWWDERARDAPGSGRPGSRPAVSRPVEAAGGLRASRPGTTAGAGRPAPAETKTAPLSYGLGRWTRSALSARLAIAALAVGGPAILICVKVLKSTHILSEQLRALR